MIKKIFFLVTISAILISTGCKKPTSSPDKNMDNMVVPNGFTFKSTRDVQITINMPSSVNFNDIKSRFDIYSSNPANGGKLLKSGSFNSEGSYTGIVKVPTTINELYVTTIAGTIIADLSSVRFSKDGGLNINFNTGYGNTPPDSIINGGKSLQNNVIVTPTILKHRYNTNSVNLVTNGDFETNDFGNIYFWNSNHASQNRWYLTTRYANTEWYNDGGNNVVRTPYLNGHYAGGASQIISASPGDVLTFTSDIKSTVYNTSNKLKVWLYLIPKNAAGNDISYFYFGLITPTTDWTSSQLVATMPTGTVSCQVLIWSHDLLSNESIMFDNVVVTKQTSDSDGDGVDDDQDDYPNDPTRAFNVYYPNNVDWGTFAYEDLWPGKGDYDFNDLILDYQFKSVLNASNELVEFFTDYSVRAIGASLTNGFAFMLPGDPANVSSVTGTNITQGYLSLNANGTEQNQPNTVIFLFDDAFSMIGSSGAGFINTKNDIQYVEPDTNQLHVLYTNPLASNVTAPYNPFLVVDETRGIEIHLAGNEPTALADQSLFGTWADDSNPATGKYYQTANNLPWALDLPVKFDYPVEQVQIIDAYNYFQTWGESGGVNYPDWYGNDAGYRNNANIYTPLTN